MVTPNLAPISLRLALFHLQCVARSRLAELEMQLLYVDNLVDACALRDAIKTTRAAIFASEVAHHRKHKGSVQ